MFKIRKVKASNFLSYENLEHKFSNGIFLITGENRDSFDANGAGKSSFIEPIVYGLYGRLIRNSKSARNWQLNGPLKVSLIFSCGKQKYRVVRTETAKKKTVRFFKKADKAWEEITGGTSTITNKLICDTIGRDYDFFVRSYIFVRDSVPFCQLNDSVIKSYLERILNMESWPEYEKAAIAIRREYDEKLWRTEDEIKATITKIDHQKMARKDWKAHHKTLVQQIESFNEETVATVSYGPVQSEERETLKRKIERSEQALELSNKLVGEFNRLVVKADYAKRHAANQRIAVEQTKKSIKHSESLSSDSKARKCHECGAVQNSEEVEKFEKKLRKSIKDSQLLLQQQEAELKQTQEDIQKYEENLKKQDKDIRIIDPKDIPELEASLRKWRERVAELDRLKMKAESQKAERKAIAEKLNSQLPDIEANIKKARKAIKKHESELGVLEEQKEEYVNSAEIAGHVREMFGPRGMKAMVFDKVLPYLEILSNQYLQILGANKFELLFASSKTLSSGAERNNISITLRNTETDSEESYGSYSGGERKRIDFAIILALCEITAKQLDSNILVFDELIEAVDASGAETIVEALREIGKTKTVIVVSHNDSVKSLFDNRIHCVKENGLTEIEVQYG